jgi:hypothetical protein
MKSIVISKPNLVLIAVTRGILGAGIALLLGDKLSAEQRRAVGWALVAVGVFTTFPLIAQVFGEGSSFSNTEG